MPKFTKIAAPALIAAMALGVAVPAQAQYNQGRDYGHGYGYGYGNNIEREIAQLERAVNRSDNRDRISEREAASLRREVAQLRYTYRSYARNGLTNREARILQNRIQNIRHHLQYERNDRDYRRR
ncbi:hypothetical protein [Novosphingobium sp. TH158]|uniref:hypothetical protein n=1 Tax=Novosphingobium sp. TH158 TaxID=2067455 RepID=UPI000C7A1B51|nr:hypothetical protein [Novosphingobium sp. TH158]PLK26343.1 hypothetical protein C0V78_05205 [Novosphingobium sp. TH158]